MFASVNDCRFVVKIFTRLGLSTSKLWLPSRAKHSDLSSLCEQIVENEVERRAWANFFSLLIPFIEEISSHFVHYFLQASFNFTS